MNTVAIHGDQVVQLLIDRKTLRPSVRRSSQEAIPTADTFESSVTTPSTSRRASPQAIQSGSAPHVADAHAQSADARPSTAKFGAPVRRFGHRAWKLLKQRRIFVPLLTACAVIAVVSVVAAFAATLGPAGVVLLTLTVPFALTAWQMWHNRHTHKLKARKEAQNTPVIIQLHHLPEVPASQSLPDELRDRLERALQERRNLDGEARAPITRVATL